jgi:hypothetical protein
MNNVTTLKESVLHHTAGAVDNSIWFSVFNSVCADAPHYIHHTICLEGRASVSNNLYHFLHEAMYEPVHAAVYEAIMRPVRYRMYLKI